MSIELTDTHIDMPLTNFAIGFRPKNHIASQISPVVPVDNKSDVYFVWGKDNFRVYETARADKSPSKKITRSVTSTAFTCINHGLQDERSIEGDSNADAILRRGLSSTRALIDGMNQAWESRVASTITSTSNVGSSATLTGTDQWNDFISSDPLENIMQGQDTVRLGGTEDSNLITIGYPVWRILMRHPQMQGLLFPHGGGIPTLSGLEKIFFPNGDGKVLIGSALQNTGSEGLADSISDIWGKNVFIGRIVPDMGDEIATYMRTFRWTPEGMPAPLTVLRDRINHAGSNHVEVTETLMWQTEKVTATALGYLITDVVS